MPVKKKPSSRTRPTLPPAEWDNDWVSSGHSEAEQTLPEYWSQESSARWFFDFLRTDLDGLAPREFLGMQADLQAFARAEILTEGKSWPNNLPPIETLKMLQAEARAGIQKVIQGGWFPLEKGIVYGVSRWGKHILKGSRQATFEDHFRVEVMDTLQESWERLHACPHCHGVFLKVGKRKYCSKPCASRANWGNFKARRPARDHHGEYARRARKRTSPKVKVAKRPRRAK